MTTYLDIGTVRIQRYLGRWPTLAGRRGASTLLNTVTDPAAVQPRVVGRATINEAAGVADGVISLVVDDPRTVKALARELLEWLGSTCPAAEFEAVWGEGESYVDTYADVLDPARKRGDTLTKLPAPYEFALVRRCDLCASDPAVTILQRPEGPARACADCDARAKAGTGRDAEAKLRSFFPGTVEVKEFKDLAALSPTTKTNHLGTIFIDGNAVGHFFTGLRSVPGARKDLLSSAFAETTFSALVAATTAVRAAGTGLPVIPHVVGGDDVLVSVPAPLALSFVREYLSAFNAGIEARVRKVLPDPAVKAPTASAAIVFSHESYPFATCVELADGLLGRAKACFAGAQSAILWLDVTREGEDLPAGRAPWLLDTLVGHGDHLDALARMPKSRRSSFENALSRPSKPVALALARRLAERLGADEVRPFLAGGDPQLLLDALSLARWWR